MELLKRNNMLFLYTKSNCPFTPVVLYKLAEDAIPYTEKNIEDPQFESELLEHGGDRKVPFLYDDETGLGMYESTAIVAYLNEYHSGNGN